MAETGDQTVLRKKIGEQSARAETRGMSMGRAMRTAVILAADGLNGLIANLASFSQSKKTLDDVVAAAETDQLIFALKNVNGALGLVRMDANVVSGLIEHLTTGRLTASNSEPRPPTAVDAMIAGDFINRILMHIEAQFQEAGEALRFVGFRSGDVFADARNVGMALDELPYQELTATLDFASGTRSGDIVMYLPLVAEAHRPDGAADRKRWRRDWSSALDQITAPVEAILCRIPMAVDAVKALKPGDLLPVAADQLEQVRVVGENRRVVAICKLGQAGGQRAVRILSHRAPSAQKLQRPLSGPMNAQGSELANAPAADLQTGPLTDDADLVSEGEIAADVAHQATDQDEPAIN